MKILVVTTKSPYPLYEGRALRTYNLIKQTAREHEVHLLSFVQTPEEVAGIGHMTSVCASVEVVPLYMGGKGSLVWDVLREVFSRSPLMAVKYRTGEMRYRLTMALRGQRFDVLHLDMLHLADYLREANGLPVVLVEHNVESALLRRRIEAESSALKRLYFRYQFKKLQRYEAWACRQADHVIAVSAHDRKQLMQMTGHERVTAIPNGVDTEFFQPALDQPRSCTAVFVGGLTWFPNLDAIEYFCREILPLIARELPDFELTVVGKNPSDGLNPELTANPRVKLTGMVEDVRPYIAAAAVYIVPLRVGGGTRLKILDALASAKALVSTSVGCEGLDLVAGRDILVADEPQAFADAVVRILKVTKVASDLSAHGRDAVQKRYAWPGIAGGLLDVYDACARRLPGYAR